MIQPLVITFSLKWPVSSLIDHSPFAMPHIKLVQSEQDFAELEQAWRRLSGEDVNCSVFSGWDWQHLWWKHYGNAADKQRKLNIIVLYDGAFSPDTVCAILPLYSQRIRFLKIGQATELRLLGTGGDTSPDYLGPLLSTSITEDCLKALCDAIATISWDVLNFTDMRDSPLFLQALSEATNKVSRYQSKSLCSTIRYIDFNAGTEHNGDENKGFDHYLKQLSSNQRKQVKRRRRRFEASGNTRFFVWPNDRSLDMAFDKLIHLHKLRWEEKSEDGSFNSQAYVEFHRSVMNALHIQDRLRLYCLEHDGDIMAMEYSYKWHNSIYSFQCGYDPKFSEHRPGQLLLNYSIESAIGENLEHYDLLKGDYSYKASAAKEQRNTRRHLAYRTTLGGLQLLASVRTKSALRKLARKSA